MEATSSRFVSLSAPLLRLRRRQFAPGPDLLQDLRHVGEGLFCEVRVQAVALPGLNWLPSGKGVPDFYSKEAANWLVSGKSQKGFSQRKLAATVKMQLDVDPEKSAETRRLPDFWVIAAAHQQFGRLALAPHL